MANQMSTIGTQNGFILTPTELNKGNGLTDTQAPHKTPSKQYYNFVAKSTTPQSSSDKGTTTQTIVLSKEQSTVESLGTDNDKSVDQSGVDCQHQGRRWDSRQGNQKAEWHRVF
nr:hypothetical protein [Nostoc mirabile]